MLTIIPGEENGDSSRSVNFICRRSRWRSLVWTSDVSGRLAVCIRPILEDKMAIEWDSTSDIYRFQDGV
jgi:hypothetical protein